MKYFIQTFGCAANVADSERVASYLEEQGYKKAKSVTEADYIVINTCMVRQMAEDRVYGLVHNLTKSYSSETKVVLTGCMVGIAYSDKSGKFINYIKERMPAVELLPISEIGFNYKPIRSNKKMALVPISNGCNNFCTYCVVPYTRGREVSRSFAEIIKECRKLKEEGYKEVMLIGQNVNSYGSDLVKSNISAKGGSASGGKNQSASWRTKTQIKNKKENYYVLPNGTEIKPVLVKHLGRQRIPTLFPYLLEEVAKMGFKKVDFMSSNPWDFSDALISVIDKYKNITRQIHLPVQSGDNEILKKMNRWYTREEYIDLIKKLRNKISAKGGSASGGKNLQLSTDIIVGFCGETEIQFKNTVDLCKKVGFCKAYISLYSDRPETVAHKVLKDDVPYQEKKRRWKILEELINKPNLKPLKH